MPNLNLDFGDGATQTIDNNGGSNGGTVDITGGAVKDNDTDITNKDNNNKIGNKISADFLLIPNKYITFASDKGTFVLLTIKKLVLCLV